MRQLNPDIPALTLVAVILPLLAVLLSISCGGSAPGEDDNRASPSQPNVSAPTAAPTASSAPRGNLTSPPIDIPVATAQAVVRRPTPAPAPAVAGRDPTPLPTISSSSIAVGTQEPSPTVIPAPTESQVLGDPSELTLLSVDEQNRESMASATSYRLEVYIAQTGTDKATVFEGRYHSPGRLWIEVARRSPNRKAGIAARKMGEQTTSPGTRWDGMQAIVGREEVFVRYRNHDIVEGRWTRPSDEVVPTEWYRLAYADWPSDQPDVFTDASGILARLLPYLARGFPPVRADDPAEGTPLIPTRLLEPYAIGTDRYPLPREVESEFAPEDLMYMYLQRPFGYGAHFTGVETGIHLLYRVIIRSNMRTSAMMVHWAGVVLMTLQKWCSATTTTRVFLK